MPSPRWVLGAIRVQDYFHVHHSNEPKDRKLQASIEGKLKEKLEAVAICSLALAAPSPFSTSGWVGIVCISLALPLAHKSLALKLNARKPAHPADPHAPASPAPAAEPVHETRSVTRGREIQTRSRSRSRCVFTNECTPPNGNVTCHRSRHMIYRSPARR
jgi:hypothetical protein